MYGRPPSAAMNMDDNQRAAAGTPGASQVGYPQSSAYQPQRVHDHQSSGSPAPMRPHPQAQLGASYSQAQHSNYSPSTAVAYGDHYGNQAQRHPQPQGVARSYPPTAMPQGYSNPDVFLVVDGSNIPEQVKNQYQQDENGNLLFFNTPPLDILPPTDDGAPLRHSLAYRARMIRLNRERRKKEEERAEEERKAAEEEQERVGKRQRTDPSNTAPPTGSDSSMYEIAPGLALPKHLYDIWVKHWQDYDKDTDELYKNLYGDQWMQGKLHALETIHENMNKANERANSKKEETAEEKHKREFKEMEEMMKPPKGGYLDDYDDRLGNFTA